MVSEINDEEALTQASQGDREAFGILYDRYIGRIYNYIYYRTGNQHDAEDLTSKVFSRAMKHITNYQNRGVPFSAWLYRIAHNLVANWHRDNSRKQEVGLDDSFWISSDIEMPENILVRSQERDDLLKIIKTLPDDRQLLLVLKFVDHLSNAEIGKIMDRTEGAIKSLYHRTLLALREEKNINSTDQDQVNGSTE
ncbi:MAG: sigma-70 family RNA polymerase sigma factor [Chloroflexi bacterium]|jgi:RNA polymerase sigma-70 factor, ECF subfamily|nr:sigma-70 family RNA polymerase sigma factor [Chloroflexota bacterium]MBT3669901.1 sigma-70 family RNA polymerase sigma factor [Chloroflexota bacterium]MBT4001974.1 sigma-70 family RNA polymerase sigma factor [Chloroflexota bacterium]MBT4304803.1 sigma-70 family RNA polymerase sigma factor [Chloroflexota bacterium]MBT4534696.1 sigma-70 family RNA polymerase sigma factor [Chloroflexota bacterium]